MNVKDFLAVYDAHCASGRALNRATAEILPVGTEVMLKMGNAIVDGEIIATSDNPLYRPDGFSLRNLKTGKVRRSTAHFAFKYCGMEIMSYAGGAS